jgi:hypothetical protein
MIRPLVVIVGAAGAVASASCAQIAGIDQTSGSGRPIDSLVVTRQSIGAMQPSAPLDLGGLQATYLVANAAAAAGIDRVPATTTTAGTWTTQLHDPAPVMFTLPDVPTPVPRLFAFPAHQLQVLYPLLEHPNPAPAPDGATFTVTTLLDAAIAMTDSFQSYVVGAWLVRGFAAGEAPANAVQIGPVTYGLTAANSVSGHAKPDRVTPADAFLTLRYAAGGLTGVAEAPPVDQAGAATIVTTGPMVAVRQDQTLSVKFNPGMLPTRYGAVRPAMQSPPSMSWNLVAAPGYKAAINAGPTLRSGALAMTDVGVTAAYGNPFAARGWNTMFVLGTSESRPYTAPGTTASISLVAGMNQFIEPSPGFELTLPAGLPIVITLDGTPLSSDTLVIKPPGKLVRVAFLIDTPAGSTAPAATLYSLQLWDLVPNPTAPTVLDRILKLDATSNEASFELPPELFQAGHSYTLRALATLGGYPAAGAGNFVTRELPLAQSFLDSGVVTVMP